MRDPTVIRRVLLVLAVTAALTAAACDEDPAAPAEVPTATPYAKVPEPTIVAASTRALAVPSAVASPTPEATATAAPTASPVPSPAAPPAPTFANYTVAPGDVISAIARRFGSTVDAIRAANGLPDDEIRSGVVLRIPVAPTDAYIVKAGETASGIASAHGVTLRALEQANGVLDGGLTQLTAGETIRVPRR